MWSLGRRLRIPQLRSGCINSTQNKIRPSRRSTRLKRNRKRRSLKQGRNRKPKKSLRRQRRNERESFNESRGEGSEDRHHRGWSWLASRSRCGGRDTRSAAFGFSEYENKGRSRHVGRKTVAAKRNGPRTRRLCCIANLAGRRRRLWAKAARLLQESFQISPTPGIAKSSERANQSRRRPDDRQICRFGNQNQDVCRSCPETNRRDEGADHFRFF